MYSEWRMCYIIGTYHCYNCLSLSVKSCSLYTVIIYLNILILMYDLSIKYVTFCVKMIEVSELLYNIKFFLILKIQKEIMVSWAMSFRN